MASDKSLSKPRSNGKTRAGEARARTRALPLGEPLRDLRISAGLTQTELAAGRFSKEYLSQIERGKTRPTPETLEWLAERLAVDPGYLESGISAEDRGRVEAALARAEALSESHRYAESLVEF